MRKFLLLNLSSLAINSLLLTFIFIGIQNNQDKKKINLLRLETIPLPVSLIMGSSFIFGSLSATLFYSILKINPKN